MCVVGGGVISVCCGRDRVISVCCGRDRVISVCCWRDGVMSVCCGRDEVAFGGGVSGSGTYIDSVTIYFLVWESEAVTQRR